MRRLKSALALLSLFSAAHAATGIGTMAPTFKVGSFVKGGPVNLAKGTHVVEFWATWCGPCKVTIPELTELAKKYKGTVDFTGVSVNEEGDDKLGQVKKYVKLMGDSMSYNVAIDTESKHMYSKWLEPVGMTTLPTAFILKDGKILWIGLPNMGLSATLEKITAGKFNIAQAKVDFAETKAMTSETGVDPTGQQVLMEKYETAWHAGDCDTALSALDELLKKHPKLKPLMLPFRAQVLLIKGTPAGYAMAESIVNSDRYRDSADVFESFAWAIVEPTPVAKNPNYRFALKLAKRAVELTKRTDASVLDTYALSLFKTGEKQRAIDVESEALGLLKGVGNPDTIKEYSDRLESYKKA